MVLIEGALIVTYGQKVRISQVVTVRGKHIVYLEHPIIVPTKEYTRDYIEPEEIDKYIEI